jgi:hypothetical protein
MTIFKIKNRLNGVYGNHAGRTRHSDEDTAVGTDSQRSGIGTSKMNAVGDASGKVAALLWCIAPIRCHEH